MEHSSSTIASFVVLEGGVDPQNMGYIIGNSLVFNVQRPSFQVPLTHSSRMPSLTIGQFNFHTLPPCSLGTSPYWSYYLTTQHATWIRQDTPNDTFNDRSVGKFSYINIVLTPSSPSSFLSQILASQVLTAVCSR